MYIFLFNSCVKFHAKSALIVEIEAKVTEEDGIFYVHLVCAAT